MHDESHLFDLIMIDGSNRSACAANAVNLIAEGGIIYLDNSDKHSSATGGDTRQAESILLAFAKERNAEIRYCTDFCPCEFFVQEGLLVQLPPLRVEV
jgi:predicted O-methyltransferase YrrM